MTPGRHGVMLYFRFLINYSEEGLGSAPGTCRCILPAGKANAPSHPHLPGEPRWLWGEGKRSGPQQWHDSKPASGVHPWPPDFCSLASGGFSWDQTALGNRVSRPTRTQPWECVYMCVHTPTYTHASVEVSKLQTKVFYRGVLR